MVDINDISVGLIVDSVSEVMDIAAKDIEPPAKFNRSKSYRYLEAFSKVGEDVKILQDTQKPLF